MSSKIVQQHYSLPFARVHLPSTLSGLVLRDRRSPPEKRRTVLLPPKPPAIPDHCHNPRSCGCVWLRSFVMWIDVRLDSKEEKVPEGWDWFERAVKQSKRFSRKVETTNCSCCVQLCGIKKHTEMEVAAFISLLWVSRERDSTNNVVGLSTMTRTSPSWKC